MAYVKLPSTLSWSNIYTLSGVTSGKSLVVTNYWTRSVVIIESATQPAIDAIGYPVMPGRTVSLSYKGLPFWVKGEDGYISVEEINKQSIEPYIGGVDLPNDVWTSNTEGLRRLRVDPSQTSLFSGTQFYSFREYSIASSTSLTIKLVTGVNSLFYDVHLTTDNGTIRMTTISGGTPSGTYSETLPIIPKNNMTGTPVYSSQNVLTAGGTVSGGTTYDIIRVVAASATAQQSTIGSSAFDERGRAPGTYYWRIENLGNNTATGTFFCWWEER